MKKYKMEIANRVIEKTRDLYIVSLRETALEMGYKHIPTEVVLHIANYLKKHAEGYRLLQIVNNPHDSLFTSLCLVDNSVEFDDWEGEE